MEFDLTEILKAMEDENTMRFELSHLRKIAALRGHKITQQEIGNIVGCSDSMISFWLRGQRVLGLETRIKMYNYIRQLEDELSVEKNETK